MRSTLLVIAALAAAVSAAPIEKRITPLCSVNNQVVYVQNIPTGTQCIRRSDSTVLAFPTGTNLLYGQLSSSAALSVAFYPDPNCVGTHTTLQCTELGLTTCSVDAAGSVHVNNLGPAVKCVGRGDATSTFSTSIVGGSVTFTNPLAQYCEIEIHLFSDTACTKHLQASPDIFCSCGTPTPPTPFCTVTNELVTAFNIPSSVHCIKRSDASTLAFPTTSTLVFGQLSTAPTLTLSLFADPTCSSGTPINIICTQNPPTTCVVTPAGVVIVSNVFAPVQCVGRGDLAGQPDGFVTPVNGVATFTLPPAQYCEIEIHLFSDPTCTTQLQAQPDIFCQCLQR